MIVVIWKASWNSDKMTYKPIFGSRRNLREYGLPGLGHLGMAMMTAVVVEARMNLLNIVIFVD